MFTQNSVLIKERIFILSASSMDVSRFSYKNLISSSQSSTICCTLWIFLWIIIICYVGTEGLEDHGLKLLFEKPDAWTDLRRINRRPLGEGRGATVEGDKIQLNISVHMTQFKPWSLGKLWNKMQDPTEHSQSGNQTDHSPYREKR
jgi:hypothetical protein